MIYVFTIDNLLDLFIQPHRMAKQESTNIPENTASNSGSNLPAAEGPTILPSNQIITKGLSSEKITTPEASNNTNANTSNQE